MSVDHQIHVYNNLSEPIYVLPTPNTDWVWADIAFDGVSSALVTVATAGLAGPAAVAGTVNAVKSISTMAKIVSTAKTLIELGSITSNTYSWYKIGKGAYIKSATDALDSAKKFLKENAAWFTLD